MLLELVHDYREAVGETRPIAREVTMLCASDGPTCTNAMLPEHAAFWVDRHVHVHVADPTMSNLARPVQYCATRQLKIYFRGWAGGRMQHMGLS